MQTNLLFLTPEDIGGVLAEELLVSGFIAQERGSDSIETRDLLKAIYIVDLEHVQAFWDNWERLEALVTHRPDGRIGYVNRTVYLVKIQLAMNSGPSGHFIGVAKPTETMLRVITYARQGD